MAQTISKHIAEGFGKGELYAALAYDAGDAFGGMAIKALMLNSTGRISFLDANAYIYASSSGVLEITATTINLNGAFAFTGTDTIALGTSGAPLTLTAGSPVLSVYTTNAGTSGSTNAENVLFNSVMTGAGQVGARVKINMSTNVVLGSWANALKAQVECNTNGGSGGVLSVACLEMYFPASAGSGLYDILELEANCPTGWVGASPSLFSYINCNQSGNTKANWDTVGNLFRISNYTAASGKFIYNDTIRILLDTTSKWIPLSTAQGSFTTSYAITSDCETDSSSTVTGAIQTDGGLGVAKSVMVGNSLDVGTRTAGTASSISTGGVDTGLLVGVVYDAQGVANTTDYIGSAAIFNYIHGVECKSGGNVTSGMSTIWANYEIDYQIYGSGGLSAGWFTVWADASGDAAHIRSSAGARALHIQGVDIAIVSGSAFDLGSNCDLFGLRVDSSVDTSATLSGHFYGINIAKSNSGKADWQRGIDINDSATGISIGSCATAGINIEGTHTLALGIGSTTALTTATTGKSAVKVQSNFSGNGYHVGAWHSSQYTLDGASYGSIYSLRGHADLEATQTTVGSAQYVVGVHGRACVTGTAYNSSLCVAGVMAQLLAGGTWTAVNKAYCLWVDNQLATNPSAGTVSMVGIRQNNNSGTAIVDHIFDIYGAVVANFINFDSCVSGGFIGTTVTADPTIATYRPIKVLIDGDTYYLLAVTI